MSSIVALRVLFAGTGPHRGDEGDGREYASLRDQSRDVSKESGHAADDATLAALRVGNHDVFESLFRTHYPGLCRFARAIMRADDDLASDIVEDVFTWLWESRARLEVRGTLASYLYSAVRHRALNALRNQRRQSVLQTRFMYDIAGTRVEEQSVAVDSIRGVAGSPVESNDLLDAVHVVISTLPERRRLAITLRWESGLGNTEIAAILGITPQSVANLLQRALADLRAAFPSEFR